MNNPAEENMKATRPGLASAKILEAGVEYLRRNASKDWRVVDNAFNRAWNPAIIGVVFVAPPSYTCVVETDARPDFFDYAEYRDWTGGAA